MSTEPSDEEDAIVRASMQDLARGIKQALPPGWCFFLFAAPSHEHAKEGRANYVSTIERKSAINCMKEFIIKAGAGEEWMKHIE